MYEYEKALLKKKLGECYDVFKEYKCFLAGGAITSIFTGNEINDYDIYFRSQQDVYDYMTEMPNSSWTIAASDKSFTVKTVDGFIVQPIFFRYFNSAEEIFESFDFTVCMGAFDFDKEEFVLHDDFLKDNVSRRLVFNSKTTFPIISALRISKYKERGYNIDRRQFMRIMLAISKLKINSVAMLKRHLGGMYGEDIGRYLEIKEDEPFSLDNIIERMSEYSLEEHAEEIPTVYFDGMWEIYVAKKLGMRLPYYQIGERYYTRRGNGLLHINYKEIDDNFYLDNSFMTTEFPMVRYKCVRKVGEGVYQSYYDNTFKYELGRIAIAKNRAGLYCVDESGIPTCQYSNEGDAVMLKLLIMDARDVVGGFRNLFKGTIQASQVYVWEEMPIKRKDNKA